MFSKDYRERLEALFAKNGWNADRISRSFAGKLRYRLPSMEHDGRFCIQVEFNQTREEEYGFRAGIALMLAREMDRFHCYLYIEGECRPLHDPVVIPVLYGFTAQINQIHTVVSGLEYVYKIAGLKCLKYFPNGKHELP